MKRVGVVGIGDMGSGLAKNLMAAGFEVFGFDPAEARAKAFAAAGGRLLSSPQEVGAQSEAVFVMVLNGGQAKQVVLGAEGEGGLRASMAPGSVIVLTATIKPGEARDLAAALEGSGIHLVDTPVSGGFPGAQNGTLTMMAAGTDQALAAARPAMEAVSATIHRVGAEPGMGQTVKACLQALIGSVFSAAFEASALAARAGVKGEVLHQVVSTSSAGSVITSGALENVMNRRFEGTGSHIDTMHKDLTISLDLARDLGVPLFMAATAMQLFEAARTRHPEGDNQVVARIYEEIVG
nr:NAD(P)-dependent oxidoreductase [Kiloniellales bacterium]